MLDIFPYLLGLQIFSSIVIILLVLLQNGKGADIGGSSIYNASADSFFGSSGSVDFLYKLTKFFAMLFFSSTIGVTYVQHKHAISKENFLQMQNVENNRSIPKLNNSFENKPNIIKND